MPGEEQGLSIPETPLHMAQRYVNDLLRQVRELQAIGEAGGRLL